MDTFCLRADLGTGPICDDAGNEVDLQHLPLSQRLVLALTDWSEFFGEVEGDLSDPDIAAEFVGQGYKLAHALRRELKGRSIYYLEPVTGERLPIG